MEGPRVALQSQEQVAEKYMSASRCSDTIKCRNAEHENAFWASNYMYSTLLVASTFAFASISVTTVVP